MAKKGGQRRDFMAQPDGGWLHDETALSCRKGVFYCYPVKYIGSIQVLQSLRDLNMEQKTELCREGIYRCMEAAKHGKPPKRKPSKFIKTYLADAPYIKPMELKLNISTEGIVTTGVKDKNIISNDAIGAISFAAGGEGTGYEFITYVAKDKRDNRYCHVFDCRHVADDVLATLGQCFTLLQKKPKAPPSLPDISSLKRVVSVQGRGPLPPRPSGGEGGVPPPLPRRPSAPAGDNPMYYAMEAEAPIYGDAEASMPVAQGGALTYGDEESVAQMYTAMDQTPMAQQQGMYTNGDVDGNTFVSQLNVVAKSQHLYGESDEPMYGDGEVGWNYLDLKPDPDLYGTLADLYK